MDELDFMKCISTAAGAMETPLSHVDPFFALRYQFGMLLGVEDFETEQAYHRGKMRLHNAWLHRHGVVWGLGVTLDLSSGEVRVAPGLALDPAGHELHLDAPSCLSLPAWYERHKEDPDLVEARTVDPATGRITFDAWVAMRFRACLTREVPALSEPCEGSSTDTAFSRVAELAELYLVPGAAPPRTSFHHRLRVLFGLEPATTEDAPLLEALSRVRALPADEQQQALLGLLRETSARDLAELTTALQPDGTHGGFFPGNEHDPIVLAQLRGIALDPGAAGQPFTLRAGTVDLRVRPTLLSTAALQELVFGLVSLQGTGPRVIGAKLDAVNKITLTTDRPLAAGTVVNDAFAAASRPPATPAAAWTSHRVMAIYKDATHVELTLDPASAAGALVRVIARGTGATPILGADDRPLAGGMTNDLLGGTRDGQDFIAMLRAP